MKTKIYVGAVMATAAVFSIGAAVPAAASGDNHVVGIEQTVGDPTGAVIAYTVTKLLPSADPVAYPVAGQLFEATVMAKAIQGTVVPLAPFFTARTDGGATYPALPNVSSLSAAPLGDGATTDGKIYFDVIGPVPTSVVFNDPPESVLTWKEPVPGDPTTGDSTGGGGSTGGSGGGSTGGGGSQGVTGSTGPNDVSPSTSGGDIGGGQGGTAGGGGNLSSGGGSGAPNGDTGKNNGAGGPSGG